ncbi:MAG: aldehyde dehydrogenase family protein [Streptosporangiaceae bacterium]
MTRSLDPRVDEFLAAGTTQLLIGGDWVGAADGATFETLNPATGQPLMRCASADREDVNRAVAAATEAAEGAWKKITPSERGQLLWRVAELLERDADALAELEVLDMGKPLRLARDDDLPMAVDHFRYFAGWATKLEGETIPVSSGAYFNYTVREPLGVVGLIIPWNYPLMLAAWKLAPALACGNTCVLKPAEQTPLTSVWLGRLLLEAGLPPGVVNILTGFGETAGAGITEHPGVAGVAFTGSTAVGREIVRASAGNLKRTALELGGKSPNVVFADADLDAAVAGAAHAIFYNMGQDCAAGSRLFVQDQVYDEIVSGLSAKASALRLGSGLEEGVDQGPLVSAEQLDRVTGYLRAGREEGAVAVVGGGRPDDPALSNGYYVQPTVFRDATNSMTIAREEIFGPVVTVIPFRDADDAVLQSNATNYGLGAGVWTRDIKKAHRAAAALKAGSVWINCYNVYDAASPFGGYKESGFGREMGRHNLDLYTQVKSVWVDLS